jgi:hypothetical protein
MISLCTTFTILRNKLDQPGVKTISFTTNTGQNKVIRIDPYGEMIAISDLPIRGPALKSRLADLGFFISPFADALESFFHLLIFPNDSTATGGIKIPIEDMPEGLETELISSYDNISSVNGIGAVSGYGDK